MTIDSSRKIFDDLVSQITAFELSLEDGFEVGVRFGGFGLPSTIFPASMTFHLSGLIGFHGEDDVGQIKDVFLTPSNLQVEFFSSPVIGGPKHEKIGFKVASE